MFRLAKEQMAAFSAAARKDFEDRMVLHLHERLPERCGAMSEATMRGLIQDGIANAASQGITSERAVCAHIEAMLGDAAPGGANA